jgi:PAS domain S-box-containing protein
VTHEQRQRQELELEGGERQFRTLAESIPQLAWMANPDGHIFWYNRRWYDYTGTTFEQMEGWGWQSVHHPDELLKVMERWQASIATGEPFDMVFPLKGGDGVFRPFLTRVMPVLDDEGRVTRWVGTNTDITETKRAEEDLRDARSRLESTLAAGEIGTWEFDVVNDVIRADSNLARIFGVTPDEAAAGPLAAYTRSIHPDDRDRVAATIARAVEAGETYEADYRLVGPGGTVRWVVARGRVERDPSGQALRLPGVVVDITERKQAEERERLLLAETVTANAKFRAFFEQGPLFAGIMDVDGTILEPNRLSLEACGYTREQVVGKPFWECPWWSRSAVLVEQIKAASAQAAGGETYQAEMPYFVADGSERMVDLILLPVKDETGRVLFLAPTGTDITRRRQLEDGMRKLAADLSEADRRKDEFLATLAHELRNPLAPIRNGLQILRLSRDSGQPAGQVQIPQVQIMMERQLGQLVRLVDDLLDVSRISRGKLELRKERVELAAVVSHAVETSRPVIDSGGHQLTVSLPPEPVWLDADVTRLGQVFANLLNNAAKYSERGGSIRLAVERQGGEAVVTVEDGGIGIPPHMLPRIFDLFTQVDRSLERSQGGLGIGLTLVKRLVEMHGGSVEAYSGGHGMGSEFTVRLPVLSAAAVQPPAGTGEPAQLPARCRILVADDNVDAADSLAMMLEIMGNEVRTANDGLQAVEAAAAFRPDMILLDIGMPRLNGYEACRAIREQPDGGRPVIVACTGWGQDEDRRRSREAGFNFHLVKPVDPTDLEALLAGLPANPP